MFQIASEMLRMISLDRASCPGQRWHGVAKSVSCRPGCPPLSVAKASAIDESSTTVWDADKVPSLRVGAVRCTMSFCSPGASEQRRGAGLCCTPSSLLEANQQVLS